MERRTRLIKCKILLSELSRKTPSSADYMVKVPNFYKLPEYRNTKFNLISQSFKFAGATWQLVFHSGYLVKPHYRFCLTLTRLRSEVPRHTIFNKVLLLDVNNRTDDKISHVIYNEGDKNKCVCKFSYDDTYKRYDGLESLTLVIHLICKEVAEVCVDTQPSLTNAGMTGQMKDSKISLCELSKKKSPLSVNFMLKVTNFFTLPEYGGTKYKICSRVFKFANATWRFIIESEEEPCSEDEYYDEEDEESETYARKFYLLLMRINSEKRKHSIFHNTSLLKAGIKIKDDYDMVTYPEIFYDKNHTKRLSSFSIEENSLSDFSDNLTLDVHLICEESEKVHVVQEVFSINRDILQLSQDLKSLLLSGISHDLTLRVAEKEFQVHRLILRIRSPVFELMLNHDMTEKNKGVIDIPDCDPQAMEQFLIYVYSGKVDTLNENNAFQLYYIADKYNVDLLKEQCSEFIKKSLRPSRTCDVIELATNHSDADLLKCATEYFLSHAEDIFQTLEWKSFLKSNANIANELLVKASRKRKAPEDG